mgnify:CR=1 FL=1
MTKSSPVHVAAWTAVVLALFTALTEFTVVWIVLGDGNALFAFAAEHWAWMVGLPLLLGSAAGLANLWGAEGYPCLCALSHPCSQGGHPSTPCRNPATKRSEEAD